MTRKFLFLLLPLCLLASACLPTTTTEPGESAPGDSGETTESAGGFDADVPDFVDVVLIYEWRFEFNLGMVLKDRAIVRFEDGTYTSDLDGILQTGIAASKSEKVGSWGTWEGKPGDDDFTLINSDNSELTLQASTPSSVPSDGMRLDQCYKSISSVGIATTELGGTGSSISSNEFCFQDNGAFRTESSGSLVTPEMVGSNSSADIGTYEISGNLIRLSFGNGEVVERFFGVYDVGTDQSTVSLATSVFTLPA